MKTICLLFSLIVILTLTGCLSGHYARTPDGTVNFDGQALFRIKPVTTAPTGK